jgi:signal transduction histidine kinase
MKMRPSLRLYFLGAMLFLGVSMATIFSALTVNYFIEGMDAVLRGTMVDIADTKGVRDEHPVTVLDFQIASRWQDLPAKVQENFPIPPAEVYELKKKAVKLTLFGPPEVVYFVALVENTTGEIRYVSKTLTGAMPTRMKAAGFSHIMWIFIFGISGIVIFSVLLIIIMRRVASPVEALGDWAKSLNADRLQQPPPDFSYKELNTLASIVRNSLNSVQESLDREHEFLRYASHELRTPIAVIRTNVELLHKLDEKAPLSAKQKLVLARIERAGFTMSDLTETLLWLSRDSVVSPTPEPVQLDELLTQLVEELTYLLQGKTVAVHLDSSPCLLELPLTACRIVLTNLIRNAFQHTQCGVVTITQRQGQVTIENVNTDDDGSEQANELGFGLGLKLTDKLIRRFGWDYHNQMDQAGRALFKHGSVKVQIRLR